MNWAILARGVAGHLCAMGVVHEPIEDAVGERKILASRVETGEVDACPSFDGYSARLIVK
jgi:hypothetical protein